MAIKKYGPTTPGRRGMTVIKTFYSKISDKSNSNYLNVLCI